MKLSQLGIGLDPAVCAGHLKSLLEAADEVGVRSRSTWSTARSAGHAGGVPRGAAAAPEHPGRHAGGDAPHPDGPGVVHRRQAADPAGQGRVPGDARTRRCRIVAEVTAQYLYLTDWALQNLPDPAFGTHDDRCIDQAKKSAVRLGVDRSDFEFQMLYGVRRDVQQKLADEGYRIRIYVPYGTHWYPYLMRRMAERPANLLFFLRSLVSG